jgi:hypothetical protein
MGLSSFILRIGSLMAGVRLQILASEFHAVAQRQELEGDQESEEIVSG